MTSRSDYAVPHNSDMGRVRHRNAPCTRTGQRVMILRVVRGFALVRFDGSSESVYLGDYSRQEGIVDDCVATTQTEADAFFARLEEDK